MILVAQKLIIFHLNLFLNFLMIFLTLIPILVELEITAIFMLNLITLNLVNFPIFLFILNCGRDAHIIPWSLLMTLTSFRSLVMLELQSVVF